MDFVFTTRPLVFFPLEAVLDTIRTAVFVGVAIGLWVWAISKHIHSGSSIHFTLASVPFVLMALVLLLVGYSLLLDGETSRRLRWNNYEWKSFEQFARVECWMQYNGIMDLLVWVALSSIILIGVAI